MRPIFYLTAALFSFLSSCTAPEHFAAAGSSLEVFGGINSTDGSGSFRGIGKEFDSGQHGSFGGLSIRPFEYWHMKAQAEATARAITEAQYQAAMAEREAKGK